MPSGRMIRMLPRLAACVGFLVLAGSASAQRGERRPARTQTPEEAYPRPEGAFPRGRGSETYAVRPGFSGIITATTPNQDGNFGGPSNGGSGGGR